MRRSSRSLPWAACAALCLLAAAACSGGSDAAVAPEAGATSTTVGATTASTTGPQAAATTAGSPLEQACGPAPGFRLIRFRAADGVRVAGAIAGSGPTGVVLAHQSDGDLCQWLPYAARLAGSGYRVLALAYRCDRFTTCPSAAQAYDRDVIGAAAELRRRGARRVALVGASIGGTVVLVAAARAPRLIDAVAALSAPREYPPFDALVAVRGLRQPLLLMAADDDPQFAADVRALAAVARGKTLLVLPSGGHGVALLDPGSAASFRRADAAVRRLLGASG